MFSSEIIFVSRETFLYEKPLTQYLNVLYV